MPFCNSCGKFEPLLSSQNFCVVCNQDLHQNKITPRAVQTRNREGISRLNFPMLYFLHDMKKQSDSQRQTPETFFTFTNRNYGDGSSDPGVERVAGVAEDSMTSRAQPFPDRSQRQAANAHVYEGRRQRTQNAALYPGQYVYTKSTLALVLVLLGIFFETPFDLMFEFL